MAHSRGGSAHQIFHKSRKILNDHSTVPSGGIGLLDSLCNRLGNSILFERTKVLERSSERRDCFVTLGVPSLRSEESIREGLREPLERHVLKIPKVRNIGRRRVGGILDVRDTHLDKGIGSYSE